jgi:hypothetical protein
MPSMALLMGVLLYVEIKEKKQNLDKESKIASSILTDVRVKFVEFSNLTRNFFV